MVASGEAAEGSTAPSAQSSGEWGAAVGSGAAGGGTAPSSGAVGGVDGR